MIYPAAVPAIYAVSGWFRFTAEGVFSVLGSADSADWGLQVEVSDAAKVSVNSSPWVDLGVDWEIGISGKTSWHHIAYSLGFGGTCVLLVDGVEHELSIPYDPTVTSVLIGETTSDAAIPAEIFSFRLWGKAVSVEALQELFRDGRDGKFLLEPVR